MALKYGDREEATQACSVQVKARLDPNCLVTDLPDGRVRVHARD